MSIVGSIYQVLGDSSLLLRDNTVKTTYSNYYFSLSVTISNLKVYFGGTAIK